MAKGNEFEIYVDPKDISNLILDFSRLEGIGIRIPTEQLPKPDSKKEHGVYSISFDQLAPLIISLSGTTTALISLATAIFQHKEAKEKAKKPTENPTSPVVIHVQGNVVPIAEFHTPEMLAAYLHEKLG